MRRTTLRSFVNIWNSAYLLGLARSRFPGIRQTPRTTMRFCSSMTLSPSFWTLQTNFRRRFASIWSPIPSEALRRFEMISNIWLPSTFAILPAYFSRYGSHPAFYRYEGKPVGSRKRRVYRYSRTATFGQKTNGHRRFPARLPQCLQSQDNGVEITGSFVLFCLPFGDALFSYEKTCLTYFEICQTCFKIPQR